MKINNIKISNYKSIKDIDIDLSPKVNVFIGENSVGKSNIFKAITWLIGPVYPSFNNISTEDYYMGDTSKNINISLSFDDGNKLSLSQVWYDSGNREKSGLNLNNGYITNEAREKYISSFIGVDREISDYLPSNKYTLIGRFLQDVNSKFNTEKEIDETTGEETLKSEIFKNKLIKLRDEYLFSVKDDDGNNIMENFKNILQEETAKQLNKETENFDVDLNLYDPWNFYKTLQLTVHESDMNLNFRASELGMGVQASITIAILKAYSKLKLKNNTPIFIDEPELFLHPHGRRNFYKIIRELADSGTQIFLTTHSTEFIDLGYFDEICVVRKNKDLGTYVKKANPKDFKEDLKIRTNIDSSEEDIKLHFKNAYENTGDSQKASEAIFAKKIILVEGESEALLLPYFFNLAGFDYIANGITIVRCGGKNELDRFYRLYTEFGIPCYIIFDRDAQNIGTDDEENSRKKNKCLFDLLNIDETDFPETTISDKYMMFHTVLEDNLDSASCNKKGLKLFIHTKSIINSKDTLPSWVNQLIEKIKNLPEETESVLFKENQEEDPFADLF